MTGWDLTPTAGNGKHDLSDMQNHRKSVGGGIWTPHDGRRTDFQGEEEREDHMWGLQKGDGGGVARLPPHDIARKNTGEALDMDRRSYGGEKGANHRHTGWSSPRGENGVSS